MAKFAIATRPAEAGNEAEPHWIAVSGGLLVNPRAPQTELATKDVAAAVAIGLQIEVVEASNSREIETAFWPA
jgi:hypothetical protein